MQLLFPMHMPSEKFFTLINSKILMWKKKADEIYTFLVGKPVYEDMKKDYGRIGQLAPFLK
ncbi:hypothetical protein MTBBW1_1960005 [Desulfamplus magnetovallimortis]|uniref:Uncharacterized protein n=1 Tax=Desulfamplus magnetovallimortis TaxID=1246637 RepID=A0A1W1HBG0_9BACT|nr:hypothetical protein MTBBW1_1960005 [Desulfamplus magnetovallimortis]